MKANSSPPDALHVLLNEVRGLRADVTAVLSAAPTTAPVPARYAYPEAASRLGIAERSLRAYVAEGRLAPLRFGRRCVFTEAQLDAFEREVGARPARRR